MKTTRKHGGVAANRTGSRQPKVVASSTAKKGTASTPAPAKQTSPATAAPAPWSMLPSPLVKSAPVVGWQPAPWINTPSTQPTAKPAAAAATTPGKVAAPVTDPQVDAAALYDAMRGGVTGWGTDNDKLFGVLNHKSPADIAKIGVAYKAHYKRDLVADIRDELGGLKLRRANALLAGSQTEADACAIRLEVRNSNLTLGSMGDAQTMLDIFGKASPAERVAIAKSYVTQFEPRSASGDPMTAFVNLLKPALSIRGLQQLLALTHATTARSAQAVNADTEKAALFNVSRAIEGAFSNDTGTVFKTLEGLTHDQKQLALGDTRMMQVLTRNLSAGELNQATALLREDPAAATAGQLQAALNDGMFGAKFKPAQEALQGKTVDELNAIKVAFKKQTGKDLEAVVRAKFSGKDLAVVLGALGPATTGAAHYQQLAERLYRAVDGLGTDVPEIRAVLAGQSKSDIQKIAAAYRAKYKAELRADLDGDLSGRDEFELLTQFDMGEPQTPKEQMQRADMNAIYELVQTSREGMTGASLLHGAQKLFKGQSDADLLQAQLAKAHDALNKNDLAGFSQALAGATADHAALVASKGAIANGVTMVAGATAAIVVNLVPVGGQLASAGLVALLTAGARVASNATFQGRAEGSEEILHDAMVGTVDGLANGLTMGTIGTEMKAAQGFLRNMTAGAVSTGAHSLTETATDRKTWENGIANGFVTVAQETGKSAAMGAGSGALFHVASTGVRAGVSALKPSVLVRDSEALLQHSTVQGGIQESTAAISNGTPNAFGLAKVLDSKTLLQKCNNLALDAEGRNREMVDFLLSAKYAREPVVFVGYTPKVGEAIKYLDEVATTIVGKDAAALENVLGQPIQIIVPQSKDAFLKELTGKAAVKMKQLIDDDIVNIIHGDVVMVGGEGQGANALMVRETVGQKVGTLTYTSSKTIIAGSAKLPKVPKKSVSR